MLGVSWQQQLPLARPKSTAVGPGAAAIRRRIKWHALINTEVDSWSPEGRLSMLGITKQEDWVAIVAAVPAILTCEPACLFALQESAKLLGLPATELLLQAPEALNTATTELEQCINELQQALQLPKPAVVRLLCSDLALACAGRRAVQAALRRQCSALRLTGPDGPALLGWLTTLTPGTITLTDLGNTPQQVLDLSRTLSLSPSEVVAALRAQQQHFGNALQVLQSPREVVAAWSDLCQALDVPQQEVMRALQQQLMLPSPRYSLCCAAAVAKDLPALQAACHLAPKVLLRMLLAAPGVMSLPASFWQLLFQYMLFLMPQWRQQLDRMPAAEAGIMLVELFHGTAGDDYISVGPGDSLFATADLDFSKELKVLNALLDQGIAAPQFLAQKHIRAGRVWRLIYLCNPRIFAQQQLSSSSSVSSTTASSSSPWSWVARMQLPAPLMQQLQERGALQCDLPPHAAAAGSSNSSTSSGPSSDRASCVGEAVESFWEVVAEDTLDFCARHPGYPHWLHHTLFELEWSNARTGAPLTTWDC